MKALLISIAMMLGSSSAIAAAGAGWIPSQSFRDSVAVGKTTAATTSSIVDIVSTTKGFLPPRMTTTQRGAISSPAEALTLYSLTSHKLSYYDGTSWLELASLSGTEAFTNKTISGSSNTLSNIGYSSLSLTGSIVNADVSASAAIADTKLATISTAGKVSNSATTATSANTASAIVARDGSGNFTAGTITAALTGNASTATALAANGANCSAGTYPKGVDASGAAESCTAISLTADVSGITPTANGGTGVNGSATFPTSGTVQTFTNVGNVSGKSYAQTLAPVTDATYSLGSSESFQWLNMFLSGYEDHGQISTPASPGAGHNLFYFKSDDKAYIKNSAGTEAALLTAATIPSTRAANLIINGGFHWWQATTSAGLSSSWTYGPDMFMGINATDGGVSLDQSTDVPANPLFQYSMRYRITSTDASIGSTQYAAIKYQMEGIDAARLYGQTFTMCFWAKVSAGTPTLSVAFNSPSNDRSYVWNYSPTTTWTQFCKTTTHPAAGTWPSDNSVGMAIHFAVAVGSVLNTCTADTWTAANCIGTSSTSNFMASTGSLYITGVQVNINDASQPFQLYGGGVSSDLAAAQRYYETSYEIGQTPGTSATAGHEGGFVSGYATTTTNIEVLSMAFKVTKRTKPTVRLYAYDGTADSVSGLDGGSHVGASATLDTSKVNEHGFIKFSCGSCYSAGSFYYFRFVADARL